MFLRREQGSILGAITYRYSRSKNVPLCFIILNYVLVTYISYEIHLCSCYIFHMRFIVLFFFFVLPANENFIDVIDRHGPSTRAYGIDHSFIVSIPFWCIGCI